ncbi:hypothetical protein F0267_00565 [Vibrio coralliilyticus]|uniref:Uncharacterized protein n=1 Tax=Vibrio coralliilyticus TaxID=190893 RepID=A0AAN0SJY1_9VIBR|nr:hypothetical protein [Vibrio coralliilyticus]AIW22616.1 hypothetical protein IX92_26500 [Vibrio coralliilyticus]NOH36712.1 hypothetical protein [Vibrio coralliilyticus]
MLIAIRQFNDSKRVSAVYGMVFASLVVTVPLTIFGLMLIFGDTDSSWAKLGGIWMTALGLGVAFKTMPEFIEEYRSPSGQPDDPMNLWLPVTLLIFALVSLYAKHGEHGDIVQQYMLSAPGKFMSLAAPHSFEMLENGLANGIEDFEKAK